MNCPTDDHQLEDAATKVFLKEPGVYAFTFNPSNSHQYFVPKKRKTTDESRLDLFMKWIRRTLEELLFMSNIEYVLVIEMTEPIRGGLAPGHQKPRLHGHGMIYLKDLTAIRTFLLDVAPLFDEVVQYELDTINDYAKWREYCHKHQFLGFPIITNVFWEDDAYKYMEDIGLSIQRGDPEVPMIPLIDGKSKKVKRTRKIKK